MLVELRVQNLLLIERAELLLHPGLNVITGETGAGKTVLSNALDLLLGGKPKRGCVRPGEDEAYVEGVFTLPDGFADRIGGDPELAELGDRLALDRGEVVLARRVTVAGRTRAYLDGRSVTAAELRLLGSQLLSFYGQHEHRKLTLASAQLEILDAYCGPEHLDRRATFERELAGARRLQRELEELRDRAGMRERDLDLLLFEIGEIEEVAPSEDEEAQLLEERGRLAAVESLREAAGAASAALDGEQEGGGVLERLAMAESELARSAGHDPALDALAARAQSVSYELQDLGGELHAYLEGLEADPERLAAIDERLDRLARLKRKHGGSIAAVLEHAERCRADRDRLTNAESEAAALEAKLAEATKRVEKLAADLHATREQACEGLEHAVLEQLARLAMDGASFSVELSQRETGSEDPLGRFTRSGADVAELVIGTNPGVPAGPLREIASGGELSRVMLALMSATSARAGAATVVFDEVDAGVGGATARSVGEKLRELGDARQVLCITHLPQVASLAQRHFRVTKRVGRGAGDKAPDVLATTRVERLEKPEVVNELCRMLGSDPADTGARRHAEDLLKAA